VNSLRIFMCVIFALECSRCKQAYIEYESQSQGINGRNRCRNKKESLSLDSYQASCERQAICYLTIKESCFVFYDSHLYRTHSLEPAINKYINSVARIIEGACTHGDNVTFTRFAPSTRGLTLNRAYLRRRLTPRAVFKSRRDPDERVK